MNRNPIVTPAAEPYSSLRASGLFADWARQQKVCRPFDALVRMGHASRMEIAEQLGIDLSCAWEDGVQNCNFDLSREDRPSRDEECAAAEAEAATIIGKDGDGFQARSHSAMRTLNPLASNYNWHDILSSVVGEFRIPHRRQFLRVTAVEMESGIYEWFAQEALGRLSSDEKGEIEKFLQADSDLAEQLEKAGFGPKGTRLIVQGVFKAATRGGFGTYINAVKAAAFLNRSIGTRLVMSSVTSSLKTVLRTTNFVLWAWLAKDALDFLFGSSRGRLIGPICMIHEFYLLESLEADKQ